MKIPMIEIREAALQDISLLQQLAKNVWYVTYGPLQPKEKVEYLFNLMYSIPALTEQMEEKNHKFLLARDDTGYLGYASFEFSYMGSNKTKIHKIYIMPNAQGKGVGKAMVDHIASISRKQNIRVLLLDVFRHNPAVKFYEKLGFRKTGEQITDVGHGIVMDDFVLEKNIE